MKRANTIRHAAALAAALVMAGGSAFAQSSVTYTLDADFDLGTSISVNHNPNHNQLQLDAQSQAEPFAYVAQPVEGVLLKIDTSTGKQVARYPSVYVASCPNCPVANNPCDSSGYCGDWNPSRTAVDTDGNVWVANRAFGSDPSLNAAHRGQGSVTKIGNVTAGTCVDRNANGHIDTSHDANNDGLIAENDPAEYLGQNDECLIKSFTVGAPFAVPRALAIDNDGTLWVGGYFTHLAYHMDPVTGNQIAQYDVGNGDLGDPYITYPYGFALRGDYVYGASTTTYPVVRLHKPSGAFKHLFATGNYGIAVDANGIVWTGDYADVGGISRCDFDAQNDGDNCTAIPGDLHFGIAVDPDGQIWAAGSGRIQKYSNAGVLLGSVSVPGQPYGIAVAADGRMFVAGNTGIATVDRGSVGGAPGGVFLTGPVDAPGVANAWSYTYSDMTGFVTHNIQQQTGRWNVVQNGGTVDMLWYQVSWNTEPQGFTGVGSTLTVSIRAANSVGDLGAQPFTNVPNGTDLTGLNIKGQFVEVKVEFQRDIAAPTPILSDITVKGKLSGGPVVCTEDPNSVLTRTVAPSSLGGVPNYTSLQAAYNAAANGEVIGIFGKFTENVALNGSKTLKITQCGSAQFTAANNSIPVFDITSTGALTIVSLDSVGGTIGWRVATNGHNLKSIRANGASAQGVLILGKSNAVSWNDISGNGVGMRVEGSSSDLRGGSVTNNTGDGVQFSSAANLNTIQGATVTGNGGSGILVDGFSNTIKSNGHLGPNALDGCRVTGTTNTLDGNTVESNTGNGIKVSGTNNTLSNNKVNKNGGDGFNISGSGNKFKSNASNNGSSGSSTENVGAEIRLTVAAVDQGSNKVDNISIPKSSAPAKCAFFPGIGVCE